MDGKITYYDKNLPEEIIAKIKGLPKYEEVEAKIKEQTKK
jgi:hypothetical protein